MNYLHRIAVPLLNAFFITGVLLYLMFLLVHTDHPELLTKKISVFPPISTVEEDSAIKKILPKPPLVEPVEEAPEVPQDNTKIDLDPIASIGNEGYIVERSKDGLFRLENSQLILALGFPPTYPQSQIARGTEGYAIVGFSVDASGAVYNSFIIESEPGSVFDRASLKAISKFKYKAKHVNGKPVATEGQRYMFTYKIDN